MKLEEIKQKVLSHELILLKSYCGKRTRRKYIWNENNEIERVKTEYDYWSHMAIENENRGYRISKKLYEELVKKLSTGTQ